MRIEFFLSDRIAGGIRRHIGPASDCAPKPRARQSHPKTMAHLLDVLVPALHPHLAVLHVRLARHFINGIAHRNLFCPNAARQVGQLEIESLLRGTVIFVAHFVRPAL